MKNFLKAIPILILGVLVLTAPYTAAAFGLSLIAASIAAWGFNIGWAAAYAIGGWALYGVLALVTPWLAASFTYKMGSIGVMPFHEHFKKTIWSDPVNLLYSTVLWPMGWLALNRFAMNWGMAFDAVFTNTWEYWMRDRRRGMKLEFVDFELGGTRVTYVDSTEEAARQAANELLKRQHPDRN